MTEPEDRTPDADDDRTWWFKTLNMFPFVYLPIVLLIALACAIFLPIIRRMVP